MSLSTLDYLNLSAIAYLDFDKLSIGKNIAQLIGDKVIPEKDINNPELSALKDPSSLLRSYILLNIQTTQSGMSAIALQNPDTKELIFAFRGTDIGKSFFAAIKDIETDLAIASGGNVIVKEGLNQFQDSFNFYVNTIKKAGGATNVGTISFTGHSLGGGLAQYLAYKTNGAYKTVTFDAVGIGQVLPNINPRDYDDVITDYVNENDFIGLYGTQLGRTVYIRDMGSDKLRKRNRDHDLTMKYIQGAIASAAGKGESALAAGWVLAAGLSQYGHAVENTGSEILFDAHNLSSLLNGDGTLAAETSHGDKTTSILAGATQGVLNMYTGIANGIHYIIVEIPSAVANASVKVTISLLDGGRKIATDIVQFIGNETYKIAATVFDVGQWLDEKANDFASAMMSQINTTTEWAGSIKLDLGDLGRLLNSVNGSALANIAKDTAVAIADIPAVLMRWVNSVLGGSIYVAGTGDRDSIIGYKKIPNYYSIKRSLYIEGFDGDDQIEGAVLDDTIIGGKGNDLIQGLGGDDLIFGGDGNDYLYGNEGYDRIIGGNGNDYIYGGSDLGELYGNDGNDTLMGVGLFVGGRGDDIIYSSLVDDVYVYNSGDGNDIISDGGGVDTIRFGSDIKPSDVKPRYDQYKYGAGYDFDLVLDIKGSGNIRIKDYYGRNGWTGSEYIDPSRRVERISFSDGTVWDEDKIRAITHIKYGTNDNDMLSAFDDYGFTFYGLEGDDKLYGGKSNDVLYGDDGDDFLFGDAGNDSIYGGLGSDELRGGAGDDKLYGDSGRDDLYGGDGNDILVGGQGNDSVEGGNGDDLYIFNKGDGADYISDSSGLADEVRLGYDSLDIIFERAGSNLRLRMPGSLDAITVSSWYGSDNYKIETFKSANGSVITHTQVDSLIQAMSSFQKDTGMTWEQAVINQPTQVQSIIQQYWTAPTT